MNIPDAIAQAGQYLQKVNGREPIRAEDIVQRAMDISRRAGKTWKASSFMPYDYCYNQKTQDLAHKDIVCF